MDINRFVPQGQGGWTGADGNMPATDMQNVQQQGWSDYMQSQGIDRPQQATFEAQPIQTETGTSARPDAAPKQMMPPEQQGVTNENNAMINHQKQSTNERRNGVIGQVGDFKLNYAPQKDFKVEAAKQDALNLLQTPMQRF